MQILVTGGAGFLGSNLVDLLLAHGHGITVLDNLSTGSAQNLPPDIHLIRADVRAPLHEHLRRVKPEVVVHLAAQVSVPKSCEAPAEDLAVNAGGTVNVLAAAAAVGVRKVISVSSAAVYGIPRELPLRESSPTSGVSPYGLSKLVGEHYVRLLSGMYGMTYTILRPANIYGPRQTTEGEGAVIPSFLTRFMSNRDPVIHGDGSQSRDFVFVSDMADAIRLALEAADGLTLNVSSGKGTSVLDLWRITANMLGTQSTPVFGPPRVGDIPHSVMSCEEARTHLKWSPKVGLHEGLASTIQWAYMLQAAAGLER